MGLLDLVKRAGSGIVHGIDSAAYNAVGGGLLGAAIPQQPTTGLLAPSQSQYDDEGNPIPQAPVAQAAPQQWQPTPAQRGAMRSQFLLNIGAALQQGRPLAEGVSNYQQGVVGQLQAGQAAQEAQAKKLATVAFQQEMQGAGDLTAQQRVLAKYAPVLGPQETKAYVDLFKGMQPQPEKKKFVPVGDLGYLDETSGQFTAIAPHTKELTPEQQAFAGFLQKHNGDATAAYGDFVTTKQDKPEPQTRYQVIQTPQGYARVPETGADATPQIVKGPDGKPLMPMKTAQGGVTLQLGNNAIDQAAQMYLQTGNMPSVGFGKDAAAMRTQIMNRAAEMNPNADLAAARTDYGANKGAITSLEKQQAAVNTFENTASKNLDLADSISKKVDRSGSPVLNRFLLHAKGQYAGDTDTQLLNNAVETAASEYAKVVSGGMTGGPVSDSARQHARDMLTSSMGQGTFSQAVALMKQEMGNRRSGYADQLQQLRANRPGAPAVAQPAVPGQRPPLASFFTGAK